MENDNGGSFMTGFLLGGIIGAAIGLLLAPKTGEQTRTNLMGASEEWRTRAEGLAARVSETVGPTMNVVRERVQPITDRVASTVGIPQAEPEIDSVAGTVGAPQAESEAELQVEPEVEPEVEPDDPDEKPTKSAK